MGKNKQNKFFQMKASANGKTADVFIYGEITKYAWEEYGEVSSITFKNELDELGDDIKTINLYINSPGGSVFETMAIIAMLQRHHAKIISYIDGIGASCASVLPMISDKIIMYANSMMMIHNAWTYASGNADQLRKAADDIERINQSMVQHYLTRAGDKLDEDTLKQLLDAETWLSAEEAMGYGLCDEIIPA
ncbi:TPA: Clp protease ClpP, partial [Bacillus anthracis]|nr:Clp protease ClpP [Bacillus anthracis]